MNDHPQPIVELCDVSFAYPGTPSVPVLSGVDLSVNRGELITITGRSGSGKSSLLSLLGLLERPTAGTVRIGGREVAGPRDADLHRRETFGYVFQSFHLSKDRSALANVETPLAFHGVARSERRQRSEDALASVGLAHRLDHRPTNLSGGEQQRVAIARALAVRPRLILADEPTGNLDAANAASVMELLRDLVIDGGPSVVVVTHDHHLAAAGTRRLTMVEGACGATPQELPA